MRFPLIFDESLPKMPYQKKLEHLEAIVDSLKKSGLTPFGIFDSDINRTNYTCFRCRRPIEGSDYYVLLFRGEDSTSYYLHTEKCYPGKSAFRLIK
jgi:hypothetical protein